MKPTITARITNCRSDTARLARNFLPVFLPLLCGLLIPASFAAAQSASAAIARPQAGANVVTREQEFAEDATFPKRKAIATYVNGLPEGEVRYVDPRGKLVVREIYKHGVIQWRTSFYPNGTRFDDGGYVNGLPHGVVTNFFPSGKLAFTIEWVAGVQHGRSISYFENGSKFVECQLVYGVAQGERRHYLPDGTVFGLTYWRDGLEASRRGLVEPTLEQYQQIQNRSHFNPILKTYWRSQSRPVTRPANIDVVP